MKKVILVAVLAATSLTLFSFRSVENNSNNVEAIGVTEFSIAAANFVDSAETFPDKFTRWRRTWTSYNTMKAMNISLDEMNATLEQF